MKKRILETIAMSGKYDLELQAFLDGTLKNIKFANVLETGTFVTEQGLMVEVVIKHQGNLEEILRENGIRDVRYEPLIAGYAILTIPVDRIEEVSRIWEIEYMEKAKGMRYEVDFGENMEGPQRVQNPALAAICVLPLIEGDDPLTGKGVLIAVIDSGIPGNLQEFTDENGESRIVGEVEEDLTGHGTAVASIAAGKTLGVAAGATIFSYRLQGKDAFVRSTDVMRGVVRALRIAESQKMPLVINLSVGFPYGSHRGDSLLERFLDNASEIGRTVIVVGSGNEGESNGHYATVLQENREKEIEFLVGDYESSLVMEMYLGYMNLAELQIVSPNGEVSYIHGNAFADIIQENLLYIYIGETTPYSGQKEVYLQWLPVSEYLTPGVWKIVVRAVDIRDGYLQIYMPTNGVKNGDTGFYQSTPEETVTIPGTAQKVITVGASNLYGTEYASFSGRGSRRTINGAWSNKPDLLAPGESVPAMNRNGEVVYVTGTSFATPLVTGAIALGMEWGVLRGNDRYFYGQKCKQRLIQGCRIVRGQKQMPSEKEGWGVICLTQTLT